MKHLSLGVLDVSRIGLGGVAKSELTGRINGRVVARSVSLGSSRFPRDVFVRGAERRSAMVTATGQPRAAATRTTALVAYGDIPAAAALPVA
jgi:hypothetical protein